jgi:hypothetical protein
LFRFAYFGGSQEETRKTYFESFKIRTLKKECTMISLTPSTQESFIVSFTNTQTVQRHQLKPDPRITDLFAMTREQWLPIIDAFNERFREIETSEHLAAGYELYIKVIGKGKRPMEFILEACGEREKESEVKPPRS